MSDDYYCSGLYAEEQAEAEAQPKRRPYNASASLSEYGIFPECDAQQPSVLERDGLADGHAHICSKLAEQYKSDPVLFAALTDAAAIIRDLMRELRRETERRWEVNHKRSHKNNGVRVVTSFETLMHLAAELGQARLSGDAERIERAQKAHDAYRDICLKADEMLLHTTRGELI